MAAKHANKIDLARVIDTIDHFTVDPQAIFDRYAIDHVVFPPDTPLAAWLDGSPFWQRAYTDTTAVIWVRS